MIRLRLRDSLRRDEGVAMIFVMAIGFVVTLLAAAMFASALQNQSTTRLHRNITSAQAAAEASLDDAVYQLGLVGGNGNPNWTNFQTGATAWTRSSPHPLDLGGSATGSAWLTPEMSGGTPTGNLIVYAKGQYGTNTRTIRAVVAQGAPQAFDFSMFASKGIDIHQHGGWLSPQVWTTAMHSNGYIALDYPSEYNVNKMEAVGNLTMEKGGGKIPSGTVTSTGYSWPDPLNGMCYPGDYLHPGGVTPGATGCPNKYPGTATVNGSVYAGSLTLGSHGLIKKLTPSVQLDTGQLVDGGKINGGIKVGTSNVTTCAAGCSQVESGITIKSGYAPDIVPFPSIDYSYWYRPKAQGDLDPTSPTGSHYFTSPSQFLSWATGGTATQNNYYIADNNGGLTKWTAASNHYPDVILLHGYFDITGGSLSLNYGTIQSTVQNVTHMTGGAPIIVVQGLLAVENGGVTLNSGLVIVGYDESPDGIVMPYDPVNKTPAWINTNNTTGLLKPATQTGVLAAGGQISSSDYDTDSPWSSTSTYEPLKAAPVYIRGLVYSATWNATTKTSTPQNQHWHNFDPKNLMKIYGAQVGADLHDCNNFSFTYDPIVKNAFGFGGGSVKVLDYQELGN